MLDFNLISESAIPMLNGAVDLYMKGDHAKAAAILIINSSRQEMEISDGQARIAVHGVLTQSRGFFTGTAYDEIREEIEEAIENDQVDSIVLDINSPGGAGAGLMELSSFIRDARQEKPITAELSGAATSAAYWIAAQADEIVSLSPSFVVGSIGVIIGPWMTHENLATARSSDAPLKGRQLNEPEGQEAVQSFLDDLHAQFVEDIIAGRGRGLTAKKINSDFGRGGVMSARQALDVGMIDKISPSFSAASGDESIADATVVAPASRPRFIDRAWVSSEADRRIRAHTGSTDGPNNSGSFDKKYQSYFCWFDAEASENFGSYKLPIADVDNGRMVYNVRAVRNALARLNQVDGPSQADKGRIRRNLERLLEDSKSNAKGKAIMKIEDLRAEHPELFRQVMALGHEEGVKAERDRVAAHLKMGETSGDMEAAAKFITGGNSLNEQSVQAHYMSAGMKNTERKAAENDSPDAIAQVEPPSENGFDAAALTADIVKSLS